MKLRQTFLYKSIYKKPGLDIQNALIRKIVMSFIDTLMSIIEILLFQNKLLSEIG